MEKAEQKRIGRMRRHNRIRAKVSGRSDMPRLSVYKSNRYLHVQIIDDAAGKTLAAGTTKEAAGKKKMEAATWLGTELAKRAKDAKVDRVVFDRGGFRYAGRIAALADAAREGGLKF
jgi:large subunit ribosomal protein L18